MPCIVGLIIRGIVAVWIVSIGWDIHQLIANVCIDIDS